jgi:hypothetical protein
VEYDTIEIIDFYFLKKMPPVNTEDRLNKEYDFEFDRADVIKLSTYEQLKKIEDLIGENNVPVDHLAYMKNINFYCFIPFEDEFLDKYDLMKYFAKYLTSINHPFIQEIRKEGMTLRSRVNYAFHKLHNEDYEEGFGVMEIIRQSDPDFKYPELRFKKTTFAEHVAPLSISIGRVRPTLDRTPSIISAKIKKKTECQP